MEIILEGIGKRFRKEWIFRNVHLSFLPSNCYAIVGHNGSGKSTLIQLIGNLSLPSEGSTSYFQNNVALESGKVNARISFSAPYQELIEEFTGTEMVEFHFRFREPITPQDSTQFLEMIGLGSSGSKQIKFYSSGMKQRLRLALCAFTEADIYLFDEPTTNLDHIGTAWYGQLIRQLPSDKTVIISSNIETEYKMCDYVINVADYKGKA